MKIPVTGEQLMPNMLWDSLGHDIRYTVRTLSRLRVLGADRLIFITNTGKEGDLSSVTSRSSITAHTI
jgi:hypothetical protein